MHLDQALQRADPAAPLPADARRRGELSPSPNDLILTGESSSGKALRAAPDDWSTLLRRRRCSGACASQAFMSSALLLALLLRAVLCWFSPTGASTA